MTNQANICYAILISGFVKYLRTTRKISHPNTVYLNAHIIEQIFEQIEYFFQLCPLLVVFSAHVN